MIYEYKVKYISNLINIGNSIEKQLNTMSKEGWEYKDIKYLENIDKWIVIYRKEIEE
jgi:hypothetical protein